MRITESINEYKNKLCGANKSEETIVSYMFDLKQFAKWLKGLKYDVRDIAQEDIEKYLKEISGRVMQSTQYRIVCTLRGFFNT
jgi:site-specific recombinase XerD